MGIYIYMVTYINNISGDIVGCFWYGMACRRFIELVISLVGFGFVRDFSFIRSRAILNDCLSRHYTGDIMSPLKPSY